MTLIQNNNKQLYINKIANDRDISRKLLFVLKSLTNCAVVSPFANLKIILDNEHHWQILYLDSFAENLWNRNRSITIYSAEVSPSVNLKQVLDNELQRQILDFDSFVEIGWNRNRPITTYKYRVCK